MANETRESRRGEAGARLASTGGRLKRWATSPWAAVVLLAIYYLNAVSATTGKCAAFDEIAHLTAGYTYWTTGEYRLQPENGNWPQRLAGAALLGGGFKLPALTEASWRQSDVWVFGHAFLYEVNDHRADAMLLRARAVMGLVGVAMGLMVWFWSRRLFGRVGAMLSLVLFAFCPHMLAHGPMVTSDMMAAFFFAATLAATWWVLHRVTLGTVLLAGVALGGLALAKPTMPVVLPMLLLLAVVRLVSGQPTYVGLWRATRPCTTRLARIGLMAGSAVAASALAILLIWVSYGLRFDAMEPSPLGGDRFTQSWAWVLERPDAPRLALKWVADHRLLPEGYAYGTAYALRMAGQRNTFLLGRYSESGWWWYFPYAFAIKTPLPLLGLLGLALAGSVWKWRRWGGTGRTPLGAADQCSVASDGGSTGRPKAAGQWHPADGEALVGPKRPASGTRQVLAGAYATAPLWILLLVYWAFAVTAKINIGHRHLLPTYPALFILAGAAGWWLERRGRTLAMTIVVLLLLYVADSLATRPNYLAYFNQLIGNPNNAYRHLVDSSLDWGQDLPGLRNWLDARGLNSPPAGGPMAAGSAGSTPVYISYFGTGDVRYYGIEATRLPCFVQQELLHPIPVIRGGVFCVSATMVQSVYLQWPGLWTDAYERMHWEGRSYLASKGMLEGDGAARQARLLASRDSTLLQTVQLFPDLEAGRLFAYLRQREPEAEIGHSILIYRLTDAEAREALEGQPAELVPAGGDSGRLRW